jgi:hypothetical protein
MSLIPLIITCFARLITGLKDPQQSVRDESILFIATALQVYTIWFIINLITK